MSMGYRLLLFFGMCCFVAGLVAGLLPVSATFEHLPDMAEELYVEVVDERS